MGPLLYLAGDGEEGETLRHRDSDLRLVALCWRGLSGSWEQVRTPATSASNEGPSEGS